MSSYCHLTADHGRSGVPVSRETFVSRGCTSTSGEWRAAIVSRETSIGRPVGGRRSAGGHASPRAGAHPVGVRGTVLHRRSSGRRVQLSGPSRREPFRGSGCGLGVNAGLSHRAVSFNPAFHVKQSSRACHPTSDQCMVTRCRASHDPLTTSVLSEARPGQQRARKQPPLTFHVDRRCDRYIQRRPGLNPPHCGATHDPSIHRSRTTPNPVDRHEHRKRLAFHVKRSSASQSRTRAASTTESSMSRNAAEVSHWRRSVGVSRETRRPPPAPTSSTTTRSQVGRTSTISLPRSCSLSCSRRRSLP